jgi:uncharacterized protein (DUF58 family)
MTTTTSTSSPTRRWPRQPTSSGRKRGRSRRRSGLAASRRWARVNHILIPERKDERDRYRRSPLGRALRVAFSAIEAYSREGRALLLLSVLVGCSSLDVRFTQGHQLFAMLVGLLFMSLLVRPFFGSRHLRVAIQSAERVAAGMPARFDVVLENAGPRRLTSLRVERPFLPWDGRWLRDVDGVAELLPGGRARVTTSATFVARGEHHLDHFEVGALVPLGLAVGPKRTSAGVRFLVVPPVANVVSMRLGHRLPERRGKSVPSRHAGQADIAGVRPYRAGDELKHLHARTWARTGEPHVRQYVDEREDRIALVVLVDGPHAREHVKEATLSLAAGAAARLAFHEAGLDGLSINDEWFEVEPRTGAKALDRVLDRLGVHELSRRPCAAGAHLRRHLAGVSSLVLVTAGASSSARDVVDLAARRGIPCRWVIVNEPGYGHASVPRDAVVVPAADIEDGKAIVL